LSSPAQTIRSLELLIPRSKTDAEAEGARIGIPRGKAEDTCPVRALQAWLKGTGVPDEEIMGHSRHRSLATMRSYVRPSKLSHASPAGKVGL